MSIGQCVPALDVSFVSLGVLFQGSGAFLKVQHHADGMRWKSLNKKFRLATRKVLGKI